MQKDTQEQGFLRVKEVSDLTGLASSTIYSLVRDKKIPHYELGCLKRFKKAEILAWLDYHHCPSILNQGDIQ